MSIFFNGIGEVYATFHCSDQELTAQNSVVSMVGSGAVGLCPSGGIPCGVASPGRSGACRVQVGGFAQVRFSGSAPEVGYVSLAGDGKGGVMVSDLGRKMLVVASDRSAHTVTVLL